MTMGDWIQGSLYGSLTDSYRPWTGTLAVLSYFSQFLRARPSLPWELYPRGTLPWTPRDGYIDLPGPYTAVYDQIPNVLPSRAHIPTWYYPPTPGTPLPGTVPSMLYLRSVWSLRSTLSTFCQNVD